MQHDSKECHRGTSTYALSIASILFSNCYAPFYNVYYLQCLFLENNIITDNIQKKNTAYAFPLRYFEQNNVILFLFFLRNSKKLISGVTLLSKYQKSRETLLITY